MRSLKQLPLELLLPGDRGRPILVLGNPRSLAGALQGRHLVRSETAGPVGALLRLPGGPAPLPQTLNSVRAVGRPDALLLWISEPREPQAFDERSVPSTATLLRYHSDGKALWSPGASWVVPLGGAGKLEFARRLLARPSARQPSAQQLATRYRVELLVPDEPSRNCWLLALIGDLSARGLAPLDANGLGRMERTATGLTVCQLATDDGTRLALKRAADERSAAGLSREATQLAALRARPGLPQPIVDALPRVLGSGRFQEIPWRLESWLPGRSAAELMYRPKRCERFLEAAVDWIGSLHECSRGPARPAAEYAAWARSVVERIADRAGASDDGLGRRVADYLESRLLRFSPPTVGGHGDYWLGNLLRDTETGRLTGVIDWQHGSERAPPLADLLHLLFTRKGLFSFYSQGSRLAGLLDGRLGSDDRRRIGSYLQRLGVDPGATGLLALLYWVHYLDEWEATESRKRGWYRRSYAEVRAVLASELEARLDRLGSRLEAS